MTPVILGENDENIYGYYIPRLIHVFADKVLSVDHLCYAFQSEIARIENNLKRLSTVSIGGN